MAATDWLQFWVSLERHFEHARAGIVATKHLVSNTIFVFEGDDVGIWPTFLIYTLPIRTVPCCCLLEAVGYSRNVTEADEPVTARKRAVIYQ